MISEQASKELDNNFRWSLGCELSIIWPPARHVISLGGSRQAVHAALRHFPICEPPRGPVHARAGPDQTWTGGGSQCPSSGAQRLRRRDPFHPLRRRKLLRIDTSRLAGTGIGPPQRSHAASSAHMRHVFRHCAPEIIARAATEEILVFCNALQHGGEHLECNNLCNRP